MKQKENQLIQPIGAENVLQGEVIGRLVDVRLRSSGGRELFFFGGHHKDYRENFELITLLGGPFYVDLRFGRIFFHLDIVFFILI